MLTWITCTQQAFHVVDNDYFRALIHKLDSRYLVPNRTKIKTLVMNQFEERRRRLVNDLSKLPDKIALTTDMWTSIKKEAFMGVTIHYVNEQWKLQSFLLDIIHFTTRHTGINMVNALISLLEEFQLSSKVIGITTDNASAMIVWSNNG